MSEILLALGALSLASHLAVTAKILIWWRGRCSIAGGGEPVTLVKSLSGLVPEIETNLEQCYRQTYVPIRVAFTAEREDDPALAVARRVAARHPEIPTAFHLGEPAFGPSPKIANLTPAIRAARTDWIWLTDDNLRPDPESLGRLMALSSEPDFGAASGLLCGRGGSGFWGAVESAVINTYHGRAMGAALAAGKPAPQGKSILIRRSTLDRFGGIESLGSYLGDDVRTGEELRRLGLRTYLDRRPLVQIVGPFGWAAFRRRHLRWALILKHTAPLLFWTQPIWTLLGSAVLVGAGSRSPAWVAGHGALWFLGDALLLSRQDPGGGAGRWLGWSVRQLILPLIWAQATITRRVPWRGKARFRFVRGGRVVPDRAAVSR